MRDKGTLRGWGTGCIALLTCLRCEPRSRNRSAEDPQGVICLISALSWHERIPEISRALTDMAVAQDDRQSIRYYSLSSQIMAEREAYYDVLERCQKGSGDITEWLTWFLGCFCRAIDRSEKLLATVLDKAAFWKAHNQAPLSERQRKVINRLLDAGKDGFEGGLTTRKFVSLAGVSRATAFREMDQLVKSGILKQNPGRGRNASYDLNWDSADAGSTPAAPTRK
jgi:hypothetical protein